MVGIDDVAHGKRVAFMAQEVARELGWSQERIDLLIFAGMMHDCGVSNTDTHTHLVNEFDWINSDEHCIRGAMLVNSSPLLFLHDILRYHHTHWDILEGSNLEQTLQENTNLIYLVDRVDATRAGFLTSSLTTQEIREKVYQKIEQSTGYFAPHLCEGLYKAGANLAFWYTLENDPLQHTLREWVDKGDYRSFSYDEIYQIALIFARIVDEKSHFTAEHSHKVAKIARFLGQQIGLKEELCAKLEIAGLLHDLGKLRVPDSVLDKPGTLSHTELAVLNRHSFDSYAILHKIEGFEEIALWAGMHHEKLDGEGYPYHYHNVSIPFEARILTVADIFQALIQSRPYRDSLPLEKALTILEEMAQEGKIDGSILALMVKYQETCYLLAK